MKFSPRCLDLRAKALFFLSAHEVEKNQRYDFSILELTPAIEFLRAFNHVGSNQGTLL